VASSKVEKRRGYLSLEAAGGPFRGGGLRGTAAGACGRFNGRGGPGRERSVCQLLVMPVFGRLTGAEDLRSERLVISGRFVQLHALNDVPGHRVEQHLSSRTLALRLSASHLARNACMEVPST
jgi:hypothetical protein